MLIMVVSHPSGGGAQIYVKGHPDTCPVCQQGVQPIWLVARTLADPPNFGVADAVFQCPRVACRSVFIGRYKGNSHNTAPWVLDSVAPRTFKKTAFSAEIEKVSPTFVAIYNQAMTAEVVGLDQLVGMGLRKALEFLVKDFAMSQVTGDEKEADEKRKAIRKKQLGPCIEAYIKDGPVQKAAKRATWLGNDETHYERRWEQQDITDLKRLAHLTVNAVESTIVMEQYEKEMPEA